MANEFPSRQHLRAELVRRWEANEDRGGQWADTEPIVQASQTQVLAIVALIDATTAGAATADRLGQQMKTLTKTTVWLTVAAVVLAFVQILLFFMKP